MTTLKKFLGLGMVVAAFAIAGAVPAAAQGCDDTEGHTALYTEILATLEKNNAHFKQHKKGDLATLKTLNGQTKDYLQKYGECNKDGQSFAANVNWVKGNAQGWEAALKAVEIDAVYAKYVEELAAAKWDAAIATSKDLLRVFPADKSLNIYIPLASLGLYESYKKNDKYVDLSLQNAKLVLDKINAGEASLNNTYGISPYAYTSKENTVSEMKFILGYLAYTKKGDKMGGLKQLYEVAQSPGLKKDDPRIYTSIASYYIEQGEKAGAELKALQDKIAAADAEIKKEGTTPERITELNKEKIETNNQIIAKEPYYFALAERAIDSYARAIKGTTGTTPGDKAYRDQLYAAAKAIYEKQLNKTDGKLDSFIAESTAKPLPNPTQEVVVPTAAPTAGSTTGGTSAVIAKP